MQVPEEQYSTTAFALSGPRVCLQSACSHGHPQHLCCIAKDDIYVSNNKHSVLVLRNDINSHLGGVGVAGEARMVNHMQKTDLLFPQSIIR